jgi:hypothetical protein
VVDAITDADLFQESGRMFRESRRFLKHPIDLVEEGNGAGHVVCRHLIVWVGKAQGYYLQR